MDDVTALGSLLYRRPLKVGKILAGKGENGGGGLRLESDQVGSRGFVAIGRTPDVNVGSRTEVSESFYWLVGRAILPETDRIVGSNPDNLVATESGEADGTSGVRDEVLLPMMISILATASTCPGDLPRMCRRMAQSLHKRQAHWQ